MRSVFACFLATILIGYLGAIAAATSSINDCDGCAGISTTLTCDSGSSCPGTIRLGVDCSKCCDGTTCYKKEGYSITPP